MTQNYYCFIRDKYGDCLTDGLTHERLCILNSRDFSIIINAGYSIEIINFFVSDLDSEFLIRCSRLSHSVTRFVLKHNKLPLIKLI